MSYTTDEYREVQCFLLLATVDFVVREQGAFVDFWVSTSQATSSKLRTILHGAAAMSPLQRR